MEPFQIKAKLLEKLPMPQTLFDAKGPDVQFFEATSTCYSHNKKIRYHLHIEGFVMLKREENKAIILVEHSEVFEDSGRTSKLINIDRKSIYT